MGLDQREADEPLGPSSRVHGSVQGQLGRGLGA